MFDLFPDTSHLMLDLERGDSFDRDVAVRRFESQAAVGRTVHRAWLDRARHAVGRSLIAVGSSLAFDEHQPSRSPAR
jgi:hypothetical protein